jgi:hypothetical protein
MSLSPPGSPTLVKNNEILVTDARILHIEDDTLVLGVRVHQKSMPLKITDQEVAMRIHIDRKRSNRKDMEYLAGQLTGVVPLLGLRFCHNGTTLQGLFADDDSYRCFKDSINAQRLIKSEVLRFIRRMEKDNHILITWCKYMEGDLSSLSVAVRKGLEPQLHALFVETLKTAAVKKFGAYLNHNDLTARNILYRYAEDGAIELSITDFGRSVFTTDEELVDREISHAVNNITTKSLHVKRLLAVSDRPGKRRRIDKAGGILAL